MTRREKLSYLRDISDNAANHVQKSKGEWRKFLRFYAKLYKYPFPEALLIYEQAPHVTACGELHHWNKVGRRVHRGTKGIPIINDADKNTEIRYVFDISNTYGEDRGIPRRWSLPDKYMDAVGNELQSRFRVPPPTSNQNKNLKWAVEEYVRESCRDYMPDIQHNVSDSFLEELDYDNLRKEFTDTVVDSVGYLISERLGLPQGLYDDDELAFEFLEDFNTKSAIYQAGIAVGHISRNVLTLIAEIIQNERKKERVEIYDQSGQTHDRRSDGRAVDDSGGNRGNGEQPGRMGEQSAKRTTSPGQRAVAADRQVRQSVPEFSQGELSGQTRILTGGDDLAGRMRGSGQGGAGDDGDSTKPAPRQETPPDGGLHGDGTARDGNSGSGGGSRAERNSVQAAVTPDITEEAEAEGESSPLSSSFDKTIAPDGLTNEPSDAFFMPSQEESRSRHLSEGQQSLFDREVDGERDIHRFSPDESQNTTEETDIARLFDDDGRGDGSTELEAETPIKPVLPTLPKPPNFQITPDIDIGGGGAKTKYRRNVDAIRLLKDIEAEARYATPEEQAALALYVGWGGISQVFKEGHPDWQTEYTELKELLSEREYKAAMGSTLNAHYTSTEVIEGIYAGLDRIGFKGGNVLEPAMGVGNFYGCMPDSVVSASRLYGVELDSITGRIARQLYPKADIRVQGFETANLPDNFFDAVVGNVPFGSYKLNDPKFDKYGFLIHDYFFAKTLDKVRPGGVVAFITSKGTMDKNNTTVRRYIAERTELLGAIRLPNTAFKASAGTEVTSDIIFLKKRDRLVDAENEKWVFTGKTDDGVPLNEYFLDNPHMMLGTMAFDDRMHGGNSETTLNPDGRDLREALLGAVGFLPGGALTEAVDLSDLEDNTDTAGKIPADPNVKNFCFTVMEDGGIYQRVDSRMEKRELAKTAAERVTAMIEMRALTRFILTQQLEGCTDEYLRQLQGELNGQYDRFFKRFGAINSRYNSRLFGEDADFPLLSSVEELDEDGGVTKASIFTRRTIAPEKRITHVDTPLEALPVSLNERGYVDIGIMASLSGRNYEEVIEDLRGVIFKNPAYDNPDDENNIFVGWETADEYLSGRVKNKLAAAELAARDNSIYSVNVEALRAVQPIPLEAHEISARIGVHWINVEYYRQFLLEKLNPSPYEHDRVQIHYTQQTGEWTVEKPYSRHSSVEATKTYGTERMDAYSLFEVTLNQKNARIYDTIYEDGKEKRVLNHKQTVAIRERQTKMKEDFRRWVFDDPERREELCAIYNDLFNSERSRKYDGSHLTFPGMSPEIRLDAHQRDGAARIIYGGNSLLAHVVGAGKTYTMAAAAMELKRLGLARKPCFVVPNHLVGQWANEFQRIYPTANILAATKRDFEKQNRRRFCARIATGDWDAVIIGHSSFEKVPMSRERQENRLQRDISDLSVAIQEAKWKDGKSITVKELERALRNLEYELKRLRDSPKDDLVTFEELGVDAVFTDEAHYYKNKFIFTKMNNVAGLSKARAKKSTDMDMKCEYINEQNGGPRGVIFATGTPISNSMVEMFTMQSYLQREELERLGLNHFDNWGANYGEVVSALELAPSGQGYRVRERFAKFVNLPELMAMFHKVADIQTAEMLDLPTPKIMSGKAITVAVDPSPELRAYTEKLVKRSERIYQRLVKPEDDNMLCVTNDGRNAALDMRCINSSTPDYPDSKVNVCVHKVFDIYKETEARKLTQMIFSDLSTPKSGKAFSIYDDIRDKLVALGVKPTEIAYIHEANTDEQKEKMFAAVRRGEIRVLLGSTQKMGAGTNAQRLLIALHHLDCPYRPSDLEQREGRIVRRGNLNPEVQIYQYVTKNSFDAYLWQIIESKARFIAQVMSGKNPSREMEDIDETVLNYAEVKAIATGNPLIKRKMELDIEVQRLRILESQYRADKYSLEDAVVKRYPARLAGLAESTKGLEVDISRRNAHTKADEFHMRLGKHEFTERKDAGEMLLKAVSSNQYAGKVIGFYRGFDIISREYERLTDNVKITLKGALSHTIELSDSDVGSIARIENGLNRLEEQLNDNRREAENIQRQLEAAKIQLTVPFEQEEALQITLSELESVNAALDVDKGGDVDAVLDDTTGSEKGEDVLGLDEDEAEDEDEQEM